VAFFNTDAKTLLDSQFTETLSTGHYVGYLINGFNWKGFLPLQLWPLKATTHITRSSY